MTSLIFPVTAEDRYLSIYEAAKILGVSISILRRWDQNGNFKPTILTKGKHRRYRLFDALEYKHKREVEKGRIQVSKFPIILKEDYGMVQYQKEMQVMKREIKILQLLIENNLEKPMIMIMVVGWIIGILIKLLKHLGLEDLAIMTKKIQADYNNSVRDFEKSIEEKKLDVMSKKAIVKRKVRNQPSKWENTRKSASKCFTHLVKATNNKTIDEEERLRAKKICEKILTPFNNLTGFLSDYKPGTLKHDVAKLLLTKSPSDFGYIRSNWSIRLISKVCVKHLKTKSASKSQVGRLLKQIKWNCAPKKRLHSPDPNYGQIIKKIATTLNSIEKDDMVLFGDEFKYTSTKLASKQNPKSVPYGLQDIFPYGNIRNDYLKNFSPTTLIQMTGLYNPVINKVGIIELKKANYTEFYRGLTTLLDHFIKLKRGKIYLILDNAKYHGIKILQHKLDLKYKEHIKILYLPVYSPNNNPIERIWKKLLDSTDRECNTKDDLRKSLKSSLNDFSKNKAPQNILSLTCHVCNHKWEFNEYNRQSNTKNIEKHLCFSIPELNPYTIHVLTHSQEDFFMGQYE